MSPLLIASTGFFPPAASEGAPGTDRLLLFILGVSGFAYIAIMALVVYFVFRYRYKPNKPSQLDKSIVHNTKLEIIWTLVPLFIMLFMFGWGYRNYMKLQTAPPDALEILVTGSKWKWKFEYVQSGAISSQELAVPVNKPIKFTVTATDVLHSFFVPAFRTKVDAVPNRYHTFWVTPSEVGVYDVFCAEYCGTNHSYMNVPIKVLPAEEFEKWETAILAEANSATTPEQKGKRLFELTHGCNACHGVAAGEQKTIGPNLRGLVGREEKFTDGSTLKITENNLYDYVRESVLEPTKRIVTGFAPTMPSFAGKVVKTDQTGKEDDSELRDLLAYIKSLK